MEKIRVGLVGLGFSGSLHADAYSTIKEKVDLVAVCDVDKEKAEMMACCYNTKYYTDFKEMLENETLDAVDLCVPHHLHSKFVIAAAKAGKHVMVEKPMATTVEETEKMIKETKKANVKFMVAEDQVHLPAHKLAKELIDKDAIGKIFMARVVSAVYDIPEDDKGWKLDPRNKGVLLDMAAHYFMVLFWMMGKIEKVCALAESVVVEKRESDFDDNAIAIFKFKNGAVGEISVTTTVVSEPLQRLEFYGTEGTIIIDHSCEKPLKYFSAHKGMETDGWVKPEVWHEIYPGYFPLTFSNEVKYFIDCIKENREPEFGGNMGKETIKIIEACYKAAKTGKIQIIK
jgi:UDP-N-acetylglucosamine 3-dehydrogenase